MPQYNVEQLVREFLTDKKVVGLVKIVKPLDILKTLVKHFDLLPKDAAIATLGLVKGSDPIQFERLVREGLPLGVMKTGQFPVPNKLKKKKDSLEEISPLRGEPEFSKNVFPPEHHREFPNEFPYDDANVRWSRVRGTTPRSGHQT